MNKRILVAMSGGTDSSAVCLMLQEQGYEVVGMTMRVWDLPRQFQDDATEPDFIHRAKTLAHKLDIDHHVVDVREAFKDRIVKYFIQEYTSGRTPNPCVMCNRDFKFRLMQEMADRLGCDQMATGHYVKTERRGDDVYLLMGDDAGKDQSYFLWRVPQATLRRCVFPLGGMHKADVRRYLAERQFEEPARLSESMEVCFVEADYRDFLKAQCPGLAEQVAGGWFTDTTGRRLGQHVGVPFYTVGQRKGLGIALGHPAYVLRLNAERNTIVLGEAKDLETRLFFVEDALWVNEQEATHTADLTVRIRYHSHPVSCLIRRLDDGRWLVETSEPVSAVTPGQTAAFYAGKRLLGGAVIASQKGIGAFAKG